MKVQQDVGKVDVSAIICMGLERILPVAKVLQAFLVRGALHFTVTF